VASARWQPLNLGKAERRMFNGNENDGEVMGHVFSLPFWSSAFYFYDGESMRRHNGKERVPYKWPPDNQPCQHHATSASWAHQSHNGW
jgi:hypothetical protein